MCNLHPLVRVTKIIHFCAFSIFSLKQKQANKTNKQTSKQNKNKTKQNKKTNPTIMCKSLLYKVISICSGQK